jgi:uncharacterized protein
MDGKFTAIAIIVALSFLILGCTGSISASTGNNAAIVTFHTSSGDWNVSSEIADTDASRAQGLMYRNYLEEGKGMLFVFPQPTQTSFFMKNMLFPLDIIYISNSSGNLYVTKIRNDFQPCKEQPCELDQSPHDMSYVVEVPAGWSKKYGIKLGDSVSIAD